MATPPRVLIIDDGGLAALAACIAARIDHQRHEPLPSEHGPVVWSPGGSQPEAHRRRDAAAAHAAHCDLHFLESNDVAATDDTRLLLDAAEQAVGEGIARVIWPVHRLGGADAPVLEDAAKAVDRALLVTRLIALDADTHNLPNFTIETPYADLTDKQLAELAADLDAPAHLCWWHSSPAVSSTLAELAATERTRWTRLLSDAGVAMPPTP